MTGWSMVTPCISSTLGGKSGGKPYNLRDILTSGSARTMVEHSYFKGILVKKSTHKQFYAI